MSRPPKSDFEKKSIATFKSELWSRVVVMAGIWLAVLFLILDPLGLLMLPDNVERDLELAVVVVTLLLSLMADQVLAAIGFKNARDGFAESHDKIMAAIEGSAQVQGFGTQSAFDHHILNRVASAVEVKNTFVSYKAAKGNPNAVDPKSLECYEKFFGSANADAQPKRWVDIVSYNEFFGPRYERLKATLGALNGNSRHIARVIRHNIPMLNFSIFYYDSFVEEREVVFGWLHSDISHNRRLFRSTEPALIDMFEDLFTLLSQYRLQEDVEIDYRMDNPRSGSRFSDRQGLWYCIGLSEDGQKTVSESLFRISFLEHGAEIEGEVKWLVDYGHQREGTEHINHKPDKLSYTSTKMFVEYKSSDLSRRGICVYNFSTAQGQAVMSGYLHDAGSAERIQLQGIRISDIDENHLVNGGAFEAARSQAEKTWMSKPMRQILRQGGGQTGLSG